MIKLLSQKIGELLQTKQKNLKKRRKNVVNNDFLSDLDGTLMNSKGEITIEDVEAIRRWTQKHAFGFVTGRDKAFVIN